MIILKVIGWIFTPYIMTYLQWNQLSRTIKVLSVLWSIWMAIPPIKVLLDKSASPGVIIGIIVIVLAVVLNSKRRRAGISLTGARTTKKLRLLYITGHPRIRPGTVLVEQGKAPNELIVDGHEIQVTGCQWMPSEKYVTKREKKTRSGLGGAVVGGIAGAAMGGAFTAPGIVAGAIIGKRPEQLKGKYKDDSMTVITAQINGMEMPMYFKCNAKQHQELASIL